MFSSGSALNYNIVYNVLAGGLTVTARPLIVTANGTSRVYGDANPATGTATGNNLVNGDTITGVNLTTPATTASGVGSYDLTGSNATGSGLGNYAITYATVANGLTVTPRALGIAAWPEVPRGIEWKHGVCEAFGWPHASQEDIACAWRRILGKVQGYADLEPAFLGRVEELIDFVSV